VVRSVVKRGVLVNRQFTSLCFPVVFLSVVQFLAVSAGFEDAFASDAVAFEDTVYRLPEILIEAERISEIEQLRGRPTFLTIIPMDDAGHRISSAAEYLAQTVGVHVRTTGGYGAYSTASVRGSSAKQVRVFLDGIPFNQAQSGIVDLSDLPPARGSVRQLFLGLREPEICVAQEDEPQDWDRVLGGLEPRVGPQLVGCIPQAPFDFVDLGCDGFALSVPA